MVSSKTSKTHCFAFALPGAHNPGEETARKPGNHNTQSDGSKTGEYKMIFWTLILGGPLLFSKSRHPLRMARWEGLKGCFKRRFKSNSVFALPPVCQPLPCLTWARRLLFLAVSAAWFFSLPNLRVLSSACQMRTPFTFGCHLSATTVLSRRAGSGSKACFLAGLLYGSSKGTI